MPAVNASASASGAAAGPDSGCGAGLGLDMPDAKTPILSLGGGGNAMLDADSVDDMTLGQGFSTIVTACELMSQLVRAARLSEFRVSCGSVACVQVNDVLNMSTLEAGQLQVTCQLNRSGSAACTAADAPAVLALRLSAAVGADRDPPADREHRPRAQVRD
jgi:hypothetical protein